ncbi:MAG: hypothetical protein NW205_02870 [Hyphomicrobiaceae bacterium]|nr:hypothetical protein [Hyphomicrobiaceae bacterium]
MAHRVEPHQAGQVPPELPTSLADTQSSMTGGTRDAAGSAQARSENEERMEREIAVILSRRPARKAPPRPTDARAPIGDDEVAVAQPTQRFAGSASGVYGATAGAAGRRAEEMASQPEVDGSGSRWPGGARRDSDDDVLDDAFADEDVEADEAEPAEVESEARAPRRRLWQRSTPLPAEPKKLVTIARRSRRRAGMHQALSWVVAMAVVGFILAAVALIVVGPPKGMMVWPSALSDLVGGEAPATR